MLKLERQADSGDDLYNVATNVVYQRIYVDYV
jgi:hypothetical protein